MATADKRIMTDKTGKDIVSELRKIPGAMNPLPVEKGGTGVTTPQEILELIGAEPKHNVNLEEMLQKVVRSVNGIAPDESGDLRLLKVPSADNLSSDKSIVTSNVFIEHTTGGDASVQDGFATLGAIYGNSVRSGYAPESRRIDIEAVERTGEALPITAAMNWETYISEVSNASTNKTFTFTTEWNENPETYGITVYGVPVSGDVIRVYYTAENRGTITNAVPSSLVETNWNLYDGTTGICRVLKYSETYGFKIGGAYTGISFSPAISGTKIVITPNSSGLFSIPSDGYLFVTGGNQTDTYILMTWSDWSNGYEGDFTIHGEDSIDFSDIVTANFPFGLCSVGAIRDEINFNDQTAYVRIERFAYSSANLEVAKASGRPYSYDTNWIYSVKETPVRTAFDLDGTLSVYDHGMEYFTGTTIPLPAELLFGDNLKDKLRTDVVTISSQTLSNAQKQQVRDNIGIEDFGNMMQRTFDTAVVAEDALATMPEDKQWIVAFSASNYTGELGTLFGSSNPCYVVQFAMSEKFRLQIAFSTNYNRVYWRCRNWWSNPFTGWRLLFTDDVTNADGTITKNSSISGGTMDMNICRRIGNVVTVSCRLYDIDEVSTGIFFSIPAGFRPRFNIYCNGYENITSGVSPGSRPTGVYVQTNGNVYFGYSSSSRTNQVFFSATYPI